MGSARVHSSHSLGFVRVIRVRASLHHRASEPRTLRRRDNTDDRNSIKSIFFERRYVRLRPHVVAFGTPP